MLDRLSARDILEEITWLMMKDKAAKDAQEAARRRR
jgi:hypothetical protein